MEKNFKRVLYSSIILSILLFRDDIKRGDVDFSFCLLPLAIPALLFVGIVIQAIITKLFSYLYLAD